MVKYLALHQAKCQLLKVETIIGECNGLKLNAWRFKYVGVGNVLLVIPKFLVLHQQSLDGGDNFRGYAFMSIPLNISRSNKFAGIN